VADLRESALHKKAPVARKQGKKAASGRPQRGAEADCVRLNGYAEAVVGYFNRAGVVGAGLRF